MKIVVAFCAVLVGLGSAPALSAPLRTGGVANPFDEVAPRPPRGIPNARLPNRSAAIAPLPRPKPDQTRPPAPTAASASGPIVFPPVAPLE